jgi:hypothetical protein
MMFPGKVWLRQARAEWRTRDSSDGSYPTYPCPTVADIPMGVRSMRSKIIRQAKHK